MSFCQGANTALSAAAADSLRPIQCLSLIHISTRLLLDTNLSAEAKLTGALLYTFEDGGLSAQELADVLTLPPEKVAPVFAELTGNGYLEILEENGAFGLHLNCLLYTSTPLLARIPRKFSYEEVLQHQMMQRQKMDQKQDHSHWSGLKLSAQLALQEIDMGD